MPRLIRRLKIAMLAMSLYMTWVVVTTSLRSNLFAEWPALARIPWMTATVKDFYQNLALLILWMFYKERSFWKGVLWCLAFIGLGSIATCFYVFLKLNELKPGQGLRELLAGHE